MSQKKFIIQASNTLLIFLFFIHIGAVTILFFLLNSLILKSIFIICLEIHFFICWHKYHKQRKIREIFLNLDKKWSLRNKDGFITEANLGGSSVATNFVLLLHFWFFEETANKKRKKFLPVIIFHDSMPKEDFRWLKVILKTSKNIT
jgi:hypothetical protein